MAAATDMVKEIFAKYDKDGSGDVSVSELTGALMHLNPNFSREDCAKLFANMDSNKDGGLQYEEFVDWIMDDAGGHRGAKAAVMLDKRGSVRDNASAVDATRRQKLRNKFARLDKDGNGKLDFLEIYDFLHQRYPGMTIPDLKFLYDCADKSHDGQIDFFELLDLLVTIPQQKADPDAEQSQLDQHPLASAIQRDDVKQQFEEAFQKEAEFQKKMLGKVTELVGALQDVRDEDERFKVWRNERAKMLREHYAATGHVGV
ncbi:unnamed protein product [Polarella glacialis]|uniref:EF-hand domain-containing protein n=1 Tax=Polarella glacialis TaxID=89957 RepID=A0A813J5R8_POLGL|nr:unnamed protein product [Polarella glacialis]|mmetsp:Transcript_68743/g.110783  ORF Transcript_68743/g.110783 Transcript_68743/m.110783 type:complete len:259 (-) Transcript_68743:21-797(-)|eukprot:CAMPEP_0115079302 /NCGR_PEP_ID=MMETSP0227-20121206/18033_1 /TAXON_ID=89957 /ORGANISM="Polarella glacialis, Strain CCMP 1383" /LENGTH=258 /DNA_ID=CAMNT_0002466791 /DNA_START=207 /DNA_END=983 /DNA_ORIENTATION=-